MLSITLPNLNVGKLTSRGYAYASLFANDFIAHVSHTASISHSIPPQHLNFSGETLRYYWLSFVLPAIAYKLLGTNFSLQNIILLTQLVYSILFLSILYIATKSFYRDKKTLFILMTLAVAAYSYNDFYFLFKKVVIYLPDYINSPFKKMGLIEFSDLSHGTFRYFIFEPQTLMGLSLFLIILCIHQNFAFRLNSNLATVFIAIIIGISLGIELLTGLIGIFWFVVINLTNLFLKRLSLKRVLLHYLCAGSIVLMFFLVYLKVGMFSITHGGSALEISPYITMICISPIYLPIDYGPMFIFGTLGVAMYLKSRDKEELDYVLLLGLISIFIIFFVRDSSTAGKETGLLKGAKFLQLTLIIFSGYFLQNFKENKFIPFKSKKNLYILIPIIFAIPTLFTDIKDTSNVKNAEYVAKEDVEACVWLKRNSDIFSIVQPFSYGGGFAVSGLAERSQALGWKLATHLLHDKQDQVNCRSKDIDSIFKTADLEKALNIIEKYKIDYIYLRPHDIHLLSRNPKGVQKFYENPQHFNIVYSKDNVDIFKYIRRSNLPENKG